MRSFIDPAITNGNHRTTKIYLQSIRSAI